MLTETLSGKCPCCSYDKLLQRYGSQNYFQMDGCPNCGFAYGTNHYDDEVFGVQALIEYGIHILAGQDYKNYIDDFTDDKVVVRERENQGVFYNGGQTKEDKARDKAIAMLRDKSNLEIRKLLFEWTEKTDRCDDIDTTVFVYKKEDIEKHMKSDPHIFKSC